MTARAVFDKRLPTGTLCEIFRGMNLTDIDMKILHSAVVCRTHGAARYCWSERVEALIQAGYLAIKNEYNATITEAGMAAFVRGA